jgi:Zn-finger nucleic acid-binding protein
MEERERDGLTIDVCSSCRGVWLDRGELERLLARAAEEQVRYEGGGGQTRPPGLDRGHDREHSDHGHREGEHGRLGGLGHHDDHDRDRGHHGQQFDRYGNPRKRGFLQTLGNLFD